MKPLKIFKDTSIEKIEELSNEYGSDRIQIRPDGEVWVLKKAHKVPKPKPEKCRKNFPYTDSSSTICGKKKGHRGDHVFSGYAGQFQSIRIKMIWENR